MNDELRQHKTSDKIKWILTLLAFILVGVMLAGIICGWFDKEQTEELPDETNSGLLVSEVIENNGVSLTSAKIPVREYADNGVSTFAVSAVRVSVSNPSEVYYL